MDRTATRAPRAGPAQAFGITHNTATGSSGAEESALSRPRRGFESRWGHHLRAEDRREGLRLRRHPFGVPQVLEHRVLNVSRRGLNLTLRIERRRVASPGRPRSRATWPHARCASILPPSTDPRLDATPLSADCSNSSSFRRTRTHGARTSSRGRTLASGDLIPIVFPVACVVIEVGLVRSLARPGGNITYSARRPRRCRPRRPDLIPSGQ